MTRILLNAFATRLLARVCLFMNFVLASGCATKTANELPPARPTLLVYPKAGTLAERAVGSTGTLPNTKSSSGGGQKQFPKESSPLLEKERDELVRRGISMLKKGDLGIAAALFEEAERSVALGERGLLAAALAQYLMGDTTRASNYSRALWTLLERRRTKTLEEDLQSSPHREAAFLLGVVQLKTHERQQGLFLLEKLISANPGWDAPYLALAEHYLFHNSPRLAKKVAQLGLQRFFEKGPEMHVTLARAQRALGEVDDSQQTLTRARVLFPQDSSITLWTAMGEFDGGFLTAACEKFAQVYERRPDMPAAANNFALCLTRQGEWDRAENVLKLAIAKNPELSSLRVLFGTVEKTRGNLLAAQQAWQDFLILAAPGDPNRELVQAALADLNREQGELSR